MRILHVSPLYWPSLGGGEQVTQALSERMAQEGHDVTVLTSDAASVERFWSRQGLHVTETDSLINGVRVLRLPARPFPLGQPGLFLLRGLAIRVFDPMRLKKIVRAIGAWMPRVPGFPSALEQLPDRFDLVHGFNLSWESCLIDAFEFAGRKGIAYITTPFLHTGEPGRRRVSRNYTMSHQLAALRGSCRALVQTPTEARALEALGVERERIVEIGIGIDPSRLVGGDAGRFRARHNLHGPIVAFVGRVTRDKGATALVRAMRQLWDSGLEANCVIAGLEMPDFARFMRTQAAHPRLIRLGPISEDEKRDLLAVADVVAMPSRAESFGIVYLEAWVYAKPVIAAQAGGAADVVSDGKDGYLTPFDDAAAIARRIHQLLARPDLARHMGSAGCRKLFERYTWDIIYDKTMTVYRDVVSENRM